MADPISRETVYTPPSDEFHSERNNASDSEETSGGKMLDQTTSETKLRSTSEHKNASSGQQKRAADVLLWRDKKISASVLTGATIVWVLFEWLNYHFLTLLCFVVILGMLIQFVWANASGVLNRSPSSVPRLVLPEEFFFNIGELAGSEVNRVLCFLQDVACGGNIKQFLVAVACLCAAAIIGSWCNFLTVLYVGFIAVHTLPVLYERYEDEVISFVDNVLKQLQRNHRKLDDRVLSRIPTHRGKKYE